MLTSVTPGFLNRPTAVATATSAPAQAPVPAPTAAPVAPVTAEAKPNLFQRFFAWLKGLFTHSAAPVAGGAPGDVDKFISTAKRFLGQPYLWGGGHVDRTFSKPGPVDCSGLVTQASK